MNKIILLVFSVLLFYSGGAEAQHPPRVIGEFYAPVIYGLDFGCIGDQDGDGCDEFMLSATSYSRYEIFLGGDRLGPDYNYAYNFVRGESEGPSGINIIGRFSNEKTSCYVTKNAERRENPIPIYFDFYNGIGEPEDHLWATWQSFYLRNGFNLNRCEMSRPIDFNGDGFDDFIYFQQDDDKTACMKVHFGGGELATEPDWIKRFPVRGNWDAGHFRFSGGYDVNGDGYQDILIRGMGGHWNEEHEYYDHQTRFYSLYFGGDPPDTIPAFVIWDNTYQGIMYRTNMQKGFALLPDVNDDGYADFAIYFYDVWYYPEFEISGSEDGIYLFFGRENISATPEPDMILPGMGFDTAQGNSIMGGDFNGDGIGDIVVEFDRDPLPHSEIHYYFGNRWFSGTPDAVFSGRDYQERYGLFYSIGAVGDYNGDGCDDVVAVAISDRRILVILAGSHDWQTSVSEPDQSDQSADLTCSCYPNPFNDTATISYVLP